MLLSKSLKLTVLLLSFSTMVSCSYLKPYKAPVTQGTIIKQEQANLLQDGLTMQQVQTILGPPYGKDPFNPLHWEYVFYTTDKDYYPNSVRYLALNFDSDLYLKNWEIRSQEVNIDTHDGFIDNLFSDN